MLGSPGGAACGCGNKHQAVAANLALSLERQSKKKGQGMRVWARQQGGIGR